MTFPLRGADGVFRPFLTRVQPMRDASGAVARWFGVNTEISDQAAAEEALRTERDRSRGVLEGMAEGFVLLDRNFRVIDINAEGLRIDGRTRERDARPVALGHLAGDRENRGRSTLPTSNGDWRCRADRGLLPLG